MRLVSYTTSTVQVSSGGVVVDGMHPLPVTGSFSDANGVPYSSSNRLPVDVAGLAIDTVNVTYQSVVSTVNSTSTPLAANAEFVGQWEDVTNYAAICVTYWTDQDSAPYGAGIEFSIDGVAVLPSPVSEYGTILANIPAATTLPPGARYVRTRVQNGPTAQTFLQSQVIYLFQRPGTTQTPLGAPLTATALTDVVHALAEGRDSTGAYRPLLQDANTGALEVVGTVDGSVTVTNFPTQTEIANDTGNPIPVSAAALPLPADAASETTLGRRFGGSKLAYSAVLTASGTITPSVNTKSIRVLWVAFVPNPDNASSNLVTVSLGATTIYTGYALAHWERFDGSVNQPVTITLENNQPVAVTVHYEEF